MRMTEEEFDAFQSRRQNHAQNRQVAPQPTLQKNAGDTATQPDDALESKLQGKIEKELRRRGWLFFHDNSRKKNEPGLPDLLIWAPGGRHILMELKKKGGKMSDDQKRFAARVQWLGFEWYEVKSYRQAVGILDGEVKG